MLRYVIIIAILTFVMAALAEDRQPAPLPEPKPCSFVKPIHVWELAKAMREEGCYLATGTVIRVPVDDVYPGEPGYGEGEPEVKAGEPKPPSDLSISEVAQLNSTIEWMKAHPKVIRVRVEVYLPDLELTWQQAEAKATERAKSVVDYMMEKGVDPARIGYMGMGVSNNGIAHIDFVVLEVRKD